MRTMGSKHLKEKKNTTYSIIVVFHIEYFCLGPLQRGGCLGCCYHTRHENIIIC